jgi:hypothetical protein
VVWILAARATPAAAQTQNDDLKSLRGLPGVGVLVLGLPDRSTDPAVVTTGEIQADVEAQLRQAGIRLLSRAELATIPSRPYLEINLGFVRTPADIHFYIVQVTLRQSAVLTSGQGLSVRTFEDAAAEWTEAADRGKRVRATVKEEVSRFINAWGIANRK